MPRVIRLAAAQMGSNQKAESRETILARMITLLEQAANQGATLGATPGDEVLVADRAGVAEPNRPSTINARRHR